MKAARPKGRAGWSGMEKPVQCGTYVVSLVGFGFWQQVAYSSKNLLELIMLQLLRRGPTSPPSRCEPRAALPSGAYPLGSDWR